MNYTDKEELEEELVKNIRSAIRQSHVIDTIARLSVTEYQGHLTKAHASQQILIDTFKTLALLYDIKVELPSVGMDASIVKKQCNSFIKKIESKVTIGAVPKKRMLTYTVMDENGHTSVATVTSKDIDDVNSVLYSHEYEDSWRLQEAIFDYSDTLGRIGRGILAMYEIPYNDSDDIRKITKQLNLKCKSIHDAVVEYFNAIIADNSISVTEFAEILSEIIPSGRHSGGYKWITV